MKTVSLKNNPMFWVPTLYFAEGIPYFIVNVISVTMFKRMGMANGDLALFTSLLYLPWVIKPLWSPFVDIIRTKRWWIIAMQVLISAVFTALALTLPHLPESEISTGNVPVSPFVITLILFYICAFASATHDIAADGFYMLALDSHRQSLYVGIRSTFYRIASVFGQGVLVVVAGVLEQKYSDIPRAWVMTLLLTAALFAAVTLWHIYSLPEVESSESHPEGAKRIMSEFVRAFGTFFRKPGVWVAVIFMLLYRLPEALSVKMLSPFMLDPVSSGGLGLTTVQSGMVYGTVGVIALTVGGIVGGVMASRWGLRKALWPMALSLALPCAVYLYMSIAHPSLWVVYLCVAFDQFGYGFGFTAYMLYMIYFSEGEFRTSHYAICTAFMALSMMIPGLFAGYMQESIGYTGFFIVVMVCCLATVAMTFVVRRGIDPGFGRKAG